MTSANERQVAGNHYKSNFQHWDWILALSIPYLPGQTTKYLTRWKKKNGLQDLEKSKHFLDKHIEEERAKQSRHATLTEKFLNENNVDAKERVIILDILRYHHGNLGALEQASEALDRLIAANKP